MRHSTDHTLGRPNTDVGGACVPVAGTIRGYSGHAWFANVDRRAPVVASPGLPPALRQAELALSGQARTVARRPLRIPAGDIVEGGTAHRPRTPPLRIAGPIAPVEANDNATSSSSKFGKVRTMARELLFLALLAGTLAGVYHLGRLHAFQNVIILPDPDRQGVAVT